MGRKRKRGSRKASRGVVLWYVGGVALAVTAWWVCGWLPEGSARSACQGAAGVVFKLLAGVP